MEHVVSNTIDEFSRGEWNQLFLGELEDWSYYRAVESAKLEGFSLVYFGLREKGELSAVVPGFMTNYRIDTTLNGSLRRATQRLGRLSQRLLTVRMLSLGSPVAEKCHVGLRPHDTAEDQSRLFAALLQIARDYAATHKVGMLAVKDVCAELQGTCAHACRLQRLRPLPGLPTAELPLPYSSFEQYLGSLSATTRKDVRRKLRMAASIRIEWRRDIADILPEIMRLYSSTLDQSDMRFEVLTREYFEAVLREMGRRASCVTYWLDDQLLAFNLVLHDESVLIDKYFGMDRQYAGDYNLYFVSWAENVRYCIRAGVATYQSGQSVYSDKIRLGSRLTPNWLWYRHTNSAVDIVLAAIERLFRLDRVDAEVAALLRRNHS